MIKNIFIPEKIGKNYLFSKRVLGIDIGKSSVKATLVRYKSTSITVERCIQESLESGSQLSLQKRTINALKEVVAQCKKYDVVYSAIAGSTVVFKELTLPFLEYEKIKMVINFEVEPLLPFSLSEAIIDFIIINQDKEQGTSNILVAAVQAHYIQEHLELLEQAGINPEIVTIDLFALYSLYKSIPEYAQQKGSVALIDIGLYATQIAYIVDGQLKMIRNLPQATATIAKSIAESININPNQALERLMRFGIESHEPDDFDNAMQKAIKAFWDAVQFTLSSFAMREKEALAHIVLVGGGAELQGMCSYVGQLFESSCQIFNPNFFIKSDNVRLKNMTAIPVACTTSLAIALETSLTEDFTLRRGQFDKTDAVYWLKQVVIAGTLAMFCLSFLIVSSVWQIRSLSHEVHTSEREAWNELEQTVSGVEDPDLEEAITEAKKIITKEKDTWTKFSEQSRTLFLRCLVELSMRIDKEKLGFVLEQLTMNDETITMKARASTLNAVKELELELKKSIEQTKLFVDITSPQTEDFVMKITLAKPAEDI